MMYLILLKISILKTAIVATTFGVLVLGVALNGWSGGTISAAGDQPYENAAMQASSSSSTTQSSPTQTPPVLIIPPAPQPSTTQTPPMLIIPAVPEPPAAQTPPATSSPEKLQDLRKTEAVEQIEQDAKAKEQAQREAKAREQAQREAKAREQAQREEKAREQAQHEAKAREQAEAKAALVAAGVIALSSNTMNWTDAKAYCASKGGKLPLINGRTSWDGSKKRSAYIDVFAAVDRTWPSALSSGPYWTGTLSTIGGLGRAWDVRSRDGLVDVGSNAQKRLYPVICVR
jgi:hypothetical protein